MHRSFASLRMTRAEVQVIRGYTQASRSNCRAILLDLAEDPRIRRSAAADHDGVASGLRDHGAGVFGRTDVAVADDGNLHGVFDGGDPLPSSLAAVAHLASAGVKRNGGESAILGHAGQLDADDFFIVPSGAKFHGEGNLHRGTDGFEDAADGGEVAEQAGASVALYDLFRRAAEVEIDQVEAESFDHAGGFGHDVRIAAEKLGGDRMLVLVEMEVALRLLILLAQDAVGRGELGHDEATSAQIADEAPEDSIGDSSHGREDGGGRDRDCADLESRRDRLQPSSFAGWGARATSAVARVVPVLLHGSILLVSKNGPSQRSGAIIKPSAIESPAGPAQCLDLESLTRANEVATPLSILSIRHSHVSLLGS